MLRAPILVSVPVLAVLALVGLASRAPEASPGRAGLLVPASSGDGCPFLGEGDAVLPPGHPPVPGSRALPPGHPPVEGHAATLPPGHPPVDGRGSRLPPGHPPLGDARELPMPRFDASTIVDL